MPKGLQRSINRAPEGGVPVERISQPVSTTVTVSATGSAVGFGTAVIYGLPVGTLKILSASVSLQFSGSGSDDNLTDTWEGDFSLGSTATADVTLDGTDVDIIASTAIGAATDEISPVVSAVNTTGLVLDNTSGDLEVNLNVLVDAADITDDESVDLTVQGDLDIVFIIV